MTPEPCHYCNMFVERDEEGRFYATSPSIKEPWECPANPSGHLIVTPAVPTPAEAEDREFEARTLLYRHGVQLEDFRPFTLEQIEALAEVVKNWEA